MQLLLMTAPGVQVFDTADAVGAMTLEGLRGTPDAFHPLFNQRIDES
mgnify:CR=1 FL=1